MLNVSTEYEPTFYHQAAPFFHWQQAMNDEIAAMECVQTLGVLFLPLKDITP